MCVWVGSWVGAAGGAKIRDCGVAELFAVRWGGAHTLTWVQDGAQVDSPGGRSHRCRSRGITLHTRASVSLHPCRSCVGLHGAQYILVYHGTGKFIALTHCTQLLHDTTLRRRQALSDQWQLTTRCGHLK